MQGRIAGAEGAQQSDDFCSEIAIFVVSNPEFEEVPENVKRGGGVRAWASNASEKVPQRGGNSRAIRVQMQI